MAKVYLSLGTNLGDKKANLGGAVKLIKDRIGEVTSLSSFYATEPWGFHSPNSFLNAAACVETSLSPQEVLAGTQQIERELGRLKKSHNAVYSDRIIDIDLLLYDNVVLNTPALVLPHPLMTKRSFVMDPLVEIAPDIIHPILHKPLKELKPEIPADR